MLLIQEGKLPSYHFCPMPNNDNSEFYFYIWNICCCFLHYTKKITRNFSKTAKAFNLKKVVQVCLAPSNIHRVNKDFSNSVKDQNFGVLSYRL